MNLEKLVVRTRQQGVFWEMDMLRERKHVRGRSPNTRCCVACKRMPCHVEYEAVRFAYGLVRHITWRSNKSRGNEVTCFGTGGCHIYIMIVSIICSRVYAHIS